MNNGYLRQSSNGTRNIGPFISSTDNVTPATGLTIANTDVQLCKNAAAAVSKNSGGGTHRVNGDYSFTFNSSDTDTVGELDVSVLVAGALMVTVKFTVLEEVVFDGWFTPGNTGAILFAGITPVIGWGIKPTGAIAIPD